MEITEKQKAKRIFIKREYRPIVNNAIKIYGTFSGKEGGSDGKEGGSDGHECVNHFTNYNNSKIVRNKIFV